MSEVFVQGAAEARLRGTLAVLVENAFRRLVMFGTFPIMLLTIIGRDLFVVAFGERWAEAGVYTQILSTWVFFQLMSGPLSTLFSVLERQEMGLRVNMLLIITRFLALGIGGLLGNARLALALYCQPLYALRKKHCSRFPMTIAEAALHWEQLSGKHLTRSCCRLPFPALSLASSSVWGASSVKPQSFL